MAKISALTTLTAANVVSGDMMPIVDASANETKKMLASAILEGLARAGVAGTDLATYDGTNLRLHPATATITTKPVSVTADTGSVGYGTGSGGAVTQITSRSTGVTLDKPSGAITTATTSLAAGASATFIVTNSKVAVGDVILLSIRSGQTNKESAVAVTRVAAGAFDITLHNQHASVAEIGAIIINYVVVKAVSA